VDNLKSQKVVEIRKITKHIQRKPTDSGLLIITFSPQNIPEFIHVGYERVRVCIYIPPVMCRFNCLRIGLPSKHCKNAELCLFCSQPAHLNWDSHAPTT